MQVRPATPADARAIAEVHVRSWQAGYRGIIADEVLDGLSVDEREELWRAWLGDPDNPILTLVTAPAIHGFVSLVAHARDDDLPPGTAEIPGLYVDPDHWRAGVGTALLHSALDRLWRGGATAVALWVLERNERGRAFYARHGFAPDGARQPSAPGPPEIRLLTTRTPAA